MSEEFFSAGRPSTDEFPAFMGKYIDLVSEADVMEALELQTGRFRILAESIEPSQVHRVHSPYKWTIAEVLGHCNDTERVFAYRALRFASGDQIKLPGFDQDHYVRAFNYGACELSDLVDEWVHLRRANLFLFARFSIDQWRFGGEADGSYCTVRALAYAMVGHLRHHSNILQQRLTLRSITLV
jgi:hypothetical protein